MPAPEPQALQNPEVLFMDGFLTFTQIFTPHQL